MPPGKYGMQEEWEKEGDQGIMMDFLLPTGIFLKFAVSRNDTIKSIKKVGLCPFACSLISDSLFFFLFFLCVRSITQRLTAVRCCSTADAIVIYSIYSAGF